MSKFVSKYTVKIKIGCTRNNKIAFFISSIGISCIQIPVVKFIDVKIEIIIMPYTGGSSA